MILGKVAVKGPKGVKANSEITEDLLESLTRGQWWQLALKDEADAQVVEALNEQYEIQKRTLDARFEDKVEKVRRGDDLPPIDRFADAIMRAMTKHFGNDLPEMIIEPGRCIAAEAGVIRTEVLLVSRKLSGRTPGLVLHILEPLIAAASSIVILSIPQMVLEFRLFLFVPVPRPVQAEFGCYLAVAANGLYVVGWLSEFLRPRVIPRASSSSLDGR